MTLVLVTVLGAVAAGYVFGGRLGNLGNVRIVSAWLVMASVGFQALLAGISAAGGPADALGLPLLLASHLALLVFVWRNRMLPGMPLVFLGFLGNAVVIAVNGAMPVSRAALVTVSGGREGVIPPGKHRILTEGDHLTFLADVLPIPVLRTVVSVGDLVMAAGVGLLVVALMRTHPAPEGRRSPASPPLPADETAG